MQIGSKKGVSAMINKKKHYGFYYYENFCKYWCNFLQKTTNWQKIPHKKNGQENQEIHISKTMAKQPTFDYFDKAIKILERSIFLWKKIVKGCRKFVVYNVNYFKLGMINLLFSVGMPYFV